MSVLSVLYLCISNPQTLGVPLNLSLILRQLSLLLSIHQAVIMYMEQYFTKYLHNVLI